MSRRGVLDAVVVGAGVVGAAAALGLARQGLQVALVEGREPAPWRHDVPDLRVFAVAPDNIALLEQLGVWEAIRSARSQPYRRMQVWDAAGGGTLDFDADRLGRRELGWILENGLLIDRLWKAALDAGVALHCPDKVTAREHSEDGRSEVLTLGSGERLRARLVVAADGADSHLRQMAGIHAPRHDYGQRGLVGFVLHSRSHQSTCWQRFLPGGPLAFLPFADADDGTPRSSIVWSLPDADAERLLAVDDAAFLVELSRAFDGPLGELTGVSRRAAFPLRRQLAGTQLSGRMVLVGDAAHAVHPLAGQGVNLGLRDISALLTALQPSTRRGPAHPHDDIGATHRLSRWNRQRRSDATASAYAFEAINRVFSNDALVPTLLRGHALAFAGRVPPLTRALWRHAAGL
ncbi:FAD-dependent monooxygenase [Lysobacter sp. H21R4]|uniref:FAD-dependent oxidoreductase n=1 Tax=Lysobacter sp. H21R4 TaxID=2781021 RepID=UPI001888FEFB|nr:FAD-dependent oxidoreductase [Lysobacter sp. H21R4]QOY62306.1 FAD-dependent monooxygenase [Lysobacter sp. H21R4]